MKHIVVSGSKVDDILFSLVGAKTVEYKNLLNYVESNQSKIAGVLISADKFDTESREYNKIEKMGLPVIMLPDPKGKITDDSLLTLQEKTIGMKINN